MPRYVIERSFPRGLDLSVIEVVERNADHGVTWLHSCVSDDRRRAFEVSDAPSPEAIRATSARNGLPIDRITEVRVLDPYVFLMNRELRRA
jgi:hypothetical protein